MKNNLIRKHNDVVEACYDMTVPELRLLYSCISKIEFKQTITPDQPFYIAAKEYAEAFNVSPKNVHREIRQAVESIWNREVVISREGETPLRCRWISAEAVYGNGGTELYFSSQVIPYLITLHEQGNFTIYRLENIAHLSSAYSIRLYELLTQYKNLGRREISIEQLRELLCLGTKYKTMCNLKKWVIDLAVEEINKHTDLKTSYENVKRGRKVVALLFEIQAKEPNKRKTKTYPTKTDILKAARPGEGWDEAKERLIREYEA